MLSLCEDGACICRRLEEAEDDEEYVEEADDRLSDSRHHKDNKQDKNMRRQIDKHRSLFNKSEVKVFLFQFPLARANIFHTPDLVELQLTIIDQLIVQVLVAFLTRLPYPGRPAFLTGLNERVTSCTISIHWIITNVLLLILPFKWIDITTVIAGKIELLFS